MRFIAFFLALILGLLPGLAAAGASSAPASAAAASTAALPDLNLPKLGLAGGGALPLWKAQFIGNYVYREIEGEGGVLNDPLIAQYVDHLGHRLSSVANGPGEPYRYFVVKVPAINAFALPGAYVAVFSGLFLATRKEDELAGVLAHETAHVAQRHIARTMADATYNNLINIGILLAGIVAAVSGAGMGAVLAAEGGAAQRQINYTRADEMEADRVGIDILAKAGFNPEGMVAFFQYMQRNYAFNGYDIPEFLSTHPLDLTRVSEAEMRAKNLHVKPTRENSNYALMRARLRVLASDNLSQTLEYFKMREKTLKKPWYRSAAVYGKALCLTRLEEGKRALKLIAPLAKAHSDIIALQLAKAKALLAIGDTKAGLAALAADNMLYSGNVAVTLAYARALSDANHPNKVVALLAPNLRDKSYQFYPPFFRLLGSAANKTDKKGLAYLAMARYFHARAQYHFAIIQLRLGLRLTTLSPERRQHMQKLKKQWKKDHKQAKNLGLIQRGSESWSSRAGAGY
jgi:predicted Zn-dependent protease